MSFMSFSCHPGGPIATGDAKEVTRPTVKSHDFLFALRNEVYTTDMACWSILSLSTSNFTMSLLSNRSRPVADIHGKLNAFVKMEMITIALELTSCVQPYKGIIV
jgi:hypothetical protein